MAETSFALPSSLEIFVKYDRERRLRITRFITLSFCGLLSTAIISILGYVSFTSLTSKQQEQRLLIGGFITCAALLLSMALLIVGLIATRRGNVTLASIGTIIPPSSSAITFALFWALVAGNKLDAIVVAVLATFAVSITVSSLISNPWTIVLTTAALNVPTVAITFMLPAASAIAGKQFLVVAFSLVNEWAFAAVGIIGAVTTQQALRALSESQLANEQARKLDELKDQFISSVNHELRSPVMAVQGFVELYRSTSSTLSQERRNHYIERASQAGKDLAALLASILDARRLDQGATDFTPEVVPIRESLAAAIRLIDPREGSAQERDLLVSIPANLAIWGETQRFRQILTNLISNAVKYSAPGSPIEFDAQLVTEVAIARGFRKRRTMEREMVEIRVRDYGLGIPADQIPLLFNRFVRLPRDLASKIIGNGMGLYLCKVFAEAMGGRIWIESSGVEGEGTTFFLRLPVPPAVMHDEPGPIREMVASATGTARYNMQDKD